MTPAPLKAGVMLMRMALANSQLLMPYMHYNGRCDIVLQGESCKCESVPQLLKVKFLVHRLHCFLLEPDNAQYTVVLVDQV